MDLNEHGAQEDGGDVEEEIEILPGGPPRVINLGKFIAVAYFCSCGGPFGIEDAIGAGGPLLCLLGFLILPVIWALPQALMAAELSTMMPGNGGSIIWVQRAFGSFLGWINAYNAILSAIIDEAVFPVLMADSLASFVNLTSLELFGVKVAFVILGAVINIFGLETVSRTSLLAVVLMLAPFAVEAGVVIWERKLQIASVKDIPDEIDWGLFMSTMLWSFTGWDSLGSFAGEVKNPRKTYPRGVALTLALNTINFALPIVVGYSLDPHIENWHSGKFAEVAFRVSKWLGIAIVISSFISNFGQFTANLTTCSREIWAMGTVNKLPTFVSWTWERFHTPLVAVFITIGGVLLFFNLSFPILVQFDTLISCIVLFLELAAFIRLKYTEPDTLRPYEVPGKKIGAWICSFPKLIVVLVTVGTSHWMVISISAGLNVLFIIAYLCKLWMRRLWSSSYPHEASPLIPQSSE